MKKVFDRAIERYLSRKLLVWLSGTALLLGNKIDGEQWVALALVYVGSQGLADIAAKWKGAGSEKSEG